MIFFNILWLVSILIIFGSIILGFTNFINHSSWKNSVRNYLLICEKNGLKKNPRKEDLEFATQMQKVSKVDAIIFLKEVGFDLPEKQVLTIEDYNAKELAKEYQFSREQLSIDNIQTKKSLMKRAFFSIIASVFLVIATPISGVMLGTMIPGTIISIISISVIIYKYYQARMRYIG